MTPEQYIVKGVLADFPEIADDTCEDFEFSPCDFVERFCELLKQAKGAHREPFVKETKKSNEDCGVTYIHCGLCLDELPTPGESPKSYSRLGVSFTKSGMQVWCNRHEVNVCHVDYMDHKHPADVTRRKESA